MNAIKGLLPLIVFSLVFISLFFIVSGANVIRIEANIMGGDEYVSIELDKDYVNFGNVTKTTPSKEKVCINNTGSIDVVIKTKLPADYGEKYFDYIQVKKYGDSDSAYKKIAEFNATISAKSSRCIWLNFDLNDYPDPIYGEIIGHNSNITIQAIPI